jgi:hypothetical protein
MLPYTHRDIQSERKKKKGVSQKKKKKSVGCGCTESYKGVKVGHCMRFLIRLPFSYSHGKWNFQVEDQHHSLVSLVSRRQLPFLSKTRRLYWILGSLIGKNVV